MDQAAPQPARASSIAPAHTATVAHTAQPAPGFWEETLKPGVFWNAASAIATTLAIGAAFLVPWLADLRQRKRRRLYAVAMLRSVYFEAENARRLAQHCQKQMREIEPLVGSAGDNEHAASCTGLVFDAYGKTYVPSETIFVTIKKLARTTFPAYMANRSWLVDLEPGEGGAVQNAFMEVERIVASLLAFTESWVVSRDVGRPQVAIVSTYAEAIHTSLVTAVGVLRSALGTSVKAPSRTRPK